MGRTHVRIGGILGALLVLCLLVPAAASAHRRRLTPSFAQGHAWRQGVVPRRGTHAASTLGSSNNLSFGGAIDKVGVVTGAPRVYLIFWGSQWGTQGTNSSGYYTYSGDPSGEAPDLQAFFKGLGTGGETWSGVMTQYCQGVSTGAQSCPASNSQHVGYPTGGALAGVWEDTSSAAPSQATAHQIAAEAINAANHFGDYSSSSQYFIVSPHGTYPDGFNTPSGQFCAWHDYTADSTMDGGGAVASPSGDPPVAFTNMPYVTDAGTSCGEDFVNSGSAGTLDGVTIVGGHEYAETITDTFPAGGWTDASGNETADKCAWISSGQGAAQDISLSTGSFAVQSTWANDYNSGSGGCEVSHPIVSDPSGVSVANPGNQSTTVGQPASAQMSATDTSTGSTCCTWSASGLPSGVSINSTSGLISGTAPTTAGSSAVTVTATDSSGNTGNTSFTWSWTAGPATSLSVSPTSATVAVGGSQKFTVTGTDQYGNAANVSGATWSTTAGGTVSPTSGSSTTFTATSQVSGTVTASLSGASSGSANVTVTAAPPNAIVNGGFEAGSLSGWTASGVSGAEKAVAASSGFPCYAGAYCAMLGLTSATNGASNIAQTFTAPSGTSSVSFYYDAVCTGTVKRGDYATATLKDVTTGSSVTMLARTCTNNATWVKVSHAVTAGQQYTLTLTSHDDGRTSDPTYTLFDNVSVQ